METGDYVLLTAESGYKWTIWGYTGDRVKIISISGNAVIVENEKGSRFPCNVNNLKLWTAELERLLKSTRKPEKKKR